MAFVCCRCCFSQSACYTLVQEYQSVAENVRRLRRTRCSEKVRALLVGAVLRTRVSGPTLGDTQGTLPSPPHVMKIVIAYKYHMRSIYVPPH